MKGSTPQEGTETGCFFINDRKQRKVKSAENDATSCKLVSRLCCRVLDLQIIVLTQYTRRWQKFWSRNPRLKSLFSTKKKNIVWKKGRLIKMNKFDQFHYFWLLKRGDGFWFCSFSNVWTSLKPLPRIARLSLNLTSPGTISPSIFRGFKFKRIFASTG